ncbi:hypothetical protein ABMA27_000128 [Loxostege sticticalis]|uniref:Uncharacterized protein n=1 Tax=Loxostege sticticalis TaxID=481309 RepID=A0ABR3IMB4_LOXSC
MVATQNNPAPFGASVKRFGKITVHPNLDPSGLYTVRPLGCDPCLYHPQPIHKIFEVNRNRKTDKDPWRYKKEVEEWAKNLGYRNQSILDKRRWQQSLLGPAWHDVPTLPKYEPACKNVGFGRTPRYKPSKNTIPGPGTYYKAVPFKAPYGPHSTRPSFEREEPCRFKDTCPRWSLAPDQYRIVDKESIEQKSNKIVSLRGPYDLFTGKRDGTTIKNHFNRTMRVSAATWPIALRGSLEKYKKSHFGTMNKTGRDKPYRGRNALVDIAMCLRRPEEPGPAHLNIDTPKVFKQNKCGFNSSYDKPPGYQRVIVWPGVGRYRVKKVSCGLPGHGHRHVFLSKLGRTIGSYLPEPMNSF